jgi:drug/metabolite transporter (DMT)-like permease
MKLRSIIACLFAACLTAPVAAQTPPDDGPAWAFLVGTWTCTVSNGMAPVTVTYTRGTRSASYVQHVSATLPSGVAYTAEGWLSYDPSAKRWVYIAEGALGDYIVSTSPGWHENVMVLTDVLTTGGDTGGTTTFKKLNDSTVDATGVHSSGTLSQHCVKK